MADIKISQLPAAAAALGTQEFEVNDSGTSKKVTGAQIDAYVKGSLVAADITDLTATVSELNLLDGVTATTAELNQLDGNVFTSNSTFTGDVLVADKIVHDGDTNTAIRFPAADTVTVETGGAEAMRITSGGDVGIGTTSPAFALTRKGLMIKADTADGCEIVLQSSIETGDTGLTIANLGGGNASIANRGTGFINIAVEDASYLSISTNGNERMRIDASGNVGIGTSSPSQSLETVGNIFVNAPSGNPYIQIKTAGAGNNPYLRLQADTTYWDIAGVFSEAADALHFAYGGTERMRITSTGNLGIGTTSPDRLLTVGTSAAAAAYMTVYGLGISYPNSANFAGVGNNSIGFGWSSPNIYGVVDNAVSAIIGTASDYRLKDNVETLQSGLQAVLSLRPVTYNPRDFDGSVNEARVEIGLIAHEVAEIRPSAVVGEKDAVNEEGSPKYQSVNYANLVPDLIRAVQEQQAIIEALEARITALEA
jgi:hypothetical protein